VGASFRESCSGSALPIKHKRFSEPIWHRHRFFKPQAQQLQHCHTLPSHNSDLPSVTEIPFVANLVTTWGALFLMVDVSVTFAGPAIFLSIYTTFQNSQRLGDSVANEISDVNPPPLTSL
jgi:hypothetical protein